MILINTNGLCPRTKMLLKYIRSISSLQFWIGNRDCHLSYAKSWCIAYRISPWADHWSITGVGLGKLQDFLLNRKLPATPLVLNYACDVCRYSWTSKAHLTLAWVLIIHWTNRTPSGYLDPGFSRNQQRSFSCTTLLIARRSPEIQT